MHDQENQSDQNRRLRGKVQFSILSLLMLVTSVAIMFGGARAFGAYGFVFGCFLAMIALGHMLARPNWQAGGAAGAFVLLSVLFLSWIFHGRLGQMDYRYVSDVEMKFRVVDNWLAEYQSEQGAFPKDLSELNPQDRVWIDPETPKDAESLFSYEPQESAYALTYLGEDKKLGGDGRDADIPRTEQAELKNRRVSFRAFVFETPGSGGLGFTLILSLIIAFAFTVGFTSKHDTPTAGVVGLLTVLVGSIVIGIVMAGAHIAASQSGH